ncbi:MAG: DNA/RNA nuclease SfsA [Ruminococcaceae bacterium]|nr:DNA/RNA nuclease SfsA [Oscillospiraceae bacterium]
MQYEQVVPARFIARPNRFIALVEMGGEEVVCHVKNTGRCRELLIPGATVFAAVASNPNRKTKYDVIAVRKGTRIVNIDSQAPNQLFAEWVYRSGLFQDIIQIRPETTYKSSRFDFYIEADGKKIFAEIKGVTLEQENAVFFPDAPTERGVKHMRELIACKEAGYEAYVVFVVQMRDVLYFSPNDSMHPAFGNALREAEKAGVHVLAVDCDVTEKEIEICEFVHVQL